MEERVAGDKRRKIWLDTKVGKVLDYEIYLTK